MDCDDCSLFPAKLPQIISFLPVVALKRILGEHVVGNGVLLRSLYHFEKNINKMKDPQRVMNITPWTMW